MPDGYSWYLPCRVVRVDFMSLVRPSRAACSGSKLQSGCVGQVRWVKVSRANWVWPLLSPIRLYGQTGSSPRFSTLCVAADGCADSAITVVPPELVVGKGRIFGIAAFS